MQTGRADATTWSAMRFGVVVLMPATRSFGERRGTSLRIGAWDGVRADVDLSCACMFTREMGGAGPVGGLANLDTSFDNRLVQWRSEGLFGAELGETLFVDRPPPGIAAPAILVIGLGDPDAWVPSVISLAVGIAFAAANWRRATSVAFAPSMLDGGLIPEQIGNAGELMVRAVVQAIDREARLAREGLAGHSTVREWYFDVGPERFDAVHDQFQTVLAAIGAPSV